MNLRFSEWHLEITSQIKVGLLYTARAIGLFSLFRFISRNHPRIVCYHAGSLGDESAFNPKLFCPRETFEVRMRWLLKNGFNIVTLDAAVTAKSRRRPIQPLSTVITFDDGWYSTYSELLPILSKLKLPSTLYLCTKHFIEGWPVLDVTIRYMVWRRCNAKVKLSKIKFGNGTFDLTHAPQRELLAGKVVAWIEAQNPVSAEEINHYLKIFADNLHLPFDELELERRKFQYMSPEELGTLRANGCSVELHGHVHAYPLNAPEAFRQDLQLCRQTIIGLDLPTPTHYCYSSGEYDAGAQEVLQSIGVESATTCHPGLIKSKALKQSQYYLPRFLDGEDVSMLEFQAEMSGFSDFMRACFSISLNVRRNCAKVAQLRIPVNVTTHSGRS